MTSTIDQTEHVDGVSIPEITKQHVAAEIEKQRPLLNIRAAIAAQELKANEWFMLLEPPHPHEQHPNQQCGIDEYVTVINRSTGERCHKKLYLSSKGKYFKHTVSQPIGGGKALPRMYVSEMTQTVLYVPFQVIEVKK